MERVLLFCTAQPGIVESAIRAAEERYGKDRLHFAGSAGSAFAARLQPHYIGWKPGYFSPGRAAELWTKVRTLDPTRIIIPLNTSAGEGYALLRIFARTVFDGPVDEHLPDGTVRPLESGAISLMLRPEERFHAAMIAFLSIVRPLLGFDAANIPRPAYPGVLEHWPIRDAAGPAAPRVSVVIRTYNEAAYLRKTLEMVFGQEGFDAEVIVIDSESTDNTRDIAASFPVRLFGVHKKAFSYGAALNLGTRLARGNVIVNLSAHAVPDRRRWLHELTAPLADETIAGVYGRELPLEGNCGHFEAKLLADAFGPAPSHSTTNPFFSNANAALPKRLALELPFDEHIGWGEDTLWAYEMQRRGKAIHYAPGAAVRHSHNTTMRDNFVRCLKHHRTLFATYLKGSEAAACAAFREKLPARTTSFRRFLSRERGMGPLAALLYAPYCEYVNWLGCRAAADETRGGA